MNRRSAASLIRPFGLLAAILLAAFAGVGPSALANDTPGNNGTVKIHEGNTENDPGEVRNEPHVCTFHLHFYFADPVQAGTWEIQEWAPTGEKGTVVLTGTYDTAGDGEDRDPEDGVYTLPDGHYKLFWDGDLDTDKHDKMKVFWVDCDGSEQPVSSGSVPPSSSASVPPSGSASVPPSGSASVPPSGSEAPIESGSVPPSGSASVSPSGSEAPIEGSGGPGGSVPGGGVLPLESTNPTGEVLGAEGVSNATPPPTDTESGITPSDQGWRVIVLGLAALIAAAVFVVPNPASATAASRSNRR
ncbi:MAG TPA: hypothetical protein VFK35_06885 [Candidatus Limnocylindrales bacterium]|nr:hypothetical protein [Candidatus Limnocylindrales bacterium]